MKILGIIPARGGSKGVPKKNSKMLGDKPLIAYTIQQALLSQHIDTLMVSTDEREIADIATQLGAEVPFMRPAELATDTASSISVVQHALDFMEKENRHFDAICLLQPTSPFRKKGLIDQAVETFVSQNADALVSVLPVPHEYNPHWVFESDTNGFLNIATGEKEIIKRRQELPKAYFRDGSIYITKAEIIKKGSFYGNKLSYLESDPLFYVNIDTMKDWEMAEEKLPTIINML